MPLAEAAPIVSVSSPARPVRVGLAGLGRVGRALVDLLGRKSAAIGERHAIRFRVDVALVRDAGRARSAGGVAAVTDDLARFAAADIDVAVEATTGAEPAATLARSFLSRGVPFVTANKALVAEHGEALEGIAARAGAAFRFEASVAAGIPLLSVFERSLQTIAPARVEAILNGTSNFVLTRIEEGGATLETALAEARGRGLAEADSDLDVSGTDAARKLLILVRAAVRRPVVLSLEVEGIAGVRAADADRARRIGHRLKPLACAEIAPSSPGLARGFVAPALVPEDDPLASIAGALNGVRIEGDPVGEVTFAGPGAGPTATAASIVDDLLAVAAGSPRSAALLPACGPPGRAGGSDGIATRWFLSIDPGAQEPSGGRLAIERIFRFGDGSRGILARRATRRDVESVLPPGGIRAYRVAGRDGRTAP